MAGEKEGDGQPQEPTHQENAIQNAPRGSRAGEPSHTPSPEQEAFSTVFWERFIEGASISPAGDDPVYWPINMFSQFEILIASRKDIKDLPRRQLAEELVPLQETLRKVGTAYKIIAHPHCKDWFLQTQIEDMLEMDRQMYGRDQVALSDAELAIVRKLCQTPRYALHGNTREIQPEIPFQPHKRIYNYSEVPNSSTVDLGGRRQMTTEEIRKAIAQENTKPKK